MPKQPKQNAAALPDEGRIKRAAFISRGPDAEERTVPVSFSSEEPVRDFSWMPPMVLLHSRSAVDLERLKNLGSALFNHDPDRIVGALQDVTLDTTKKKGRAVIRFDTTDDGELAFERVTSGSLKGVSVSFSVQERQVLEDGDKAEIDGRMWEGPLMVATKWEPLEISLTAVPADREVGVGRNKKEETAVPKLSAEIREVLVARGLPAGASDEEGWAFLQKLKNPEEKTPEGEKGKRKKAQAPTPPPVEEPQEADEETVERRGKALAKEENFGDEVATVAGERQRVTDIREIGRLSGMPEYEVDNWINEGKTADYARSVALQFMSARNRPVNSPGGTYVEVGLNARDKLFNAMDAHLMRRSKSVLAAVSKWEYDEKLCSDVPMDLPLIEIARQMLLQGGHRQANRWDRAQVASRALQHSTSDFPALLENIAQKSLGQGYMEARTTWQIWCSTGSLPDFKSASRVAVGDTDSFEIVQELMPITETTFSEKKETRQLSTYAKRFGVSRQALINDDLAAFSAVPQKLGASAARIIDSTVYSQLTSPPTMNEDSVALFATTHPSGANYTASGGGAPSITQLGLGLALMRKQLGVGLRSTLDISPGFLIAPVALEGATRQLLQGTIVPAQSSNVVPTWMSQITPVVTPVLDAASTAVWYLAARPNEFDTIKVEFLNGQQTPQLASIDGTAVLGREYVAYIDFSVKVFDHRGLYKNIGA